MIKDPLENGDFRSPEVTYSDGLNNANLGSSFDPLGVLKAMDWRLKVIFGIMLFALLMKFRKCK